MPASGAGGPPAAQEQIQKLPPATALPPPSASVLQPSRSQSAAVVGTKSFCCSRSAPVEPVRANTFSPGPSTAGCNMGGWSAEGAATADQHAFEDDGVGLETLGPLPIGRLKRREHALTELELDDRGLGPTEGIVLGRLLRDAPWLTKLSLSVARVESNAKP